MSTRVLHGSEVVAEVTPDPAVLRCVLVLTDGEHRRTCHVLIQRTDKGDLVDGVRAHIKKCHPERNVQ